MQPEKDFAVSGDGSAEILVSSSVYSKEAVMAATYQLTERYSVSIGEADGGFCVRLHPISLQSSEETRAVVDRLGNELLDHQLRIDLNKNFGQIRDDIVAQAFRPIQETTGEKE